MIQKLKNRAYHLLRKSEPYTKTDMVYLASGGFWLSIKTFLSTAIAFGLSVAFANLLNPTTFGEYNYVFTIFGLLTITTLIGMGTSITRAVAQGYEGTPLAALKIKIRYGLIGSFAGVAIAVYYYLQGNSELAAAFALAALFLPVVDTLSLFNAALNGKKLFNISALYEILVQGLAAAAIVVTLFFTDNLLTILAAYFVSYSFLRFVAFRAALTRHMTNRTVDPKAIVYGKHLSAMEMLSIVSSALDNVLLWQFIGPASLAIYAFAKGIPTQISVALQRIISLALPKFAERDFASIKEAMAHKMLLMFGVMLVVVTTYILAAPLIFSTLFPQYVDAVLYSQIFALTLLFFPQKFIGTAFHAHAHMRALYISSTVVPITRMALAVILVPLYGIPGILATELVTRVLNFCVLSFLLIRER